MSMTLEDVVGKEISLLALLKVEKSELQRCFLSSLATHEKAKAFRDEI